MKALWKRITKIVPARTLIGIGVGVLGVVLLILAFHLNFDRQLLQTQVTQEQQRFQAERQQVLDRFNAMYLNCMERNELFGDGTGAVCDGLLERQRCVSEARAGEALEKC